MRSFSEPQAAIIVLNWNGCADTLECLGSLRRLDYPARHVVVDNGSVDESVRIIREKFPEVELIETGANLGYAGGNNVGIRAMLERGAKYLVLLNNDTIMDPDALTKLIQAGESRPEAGIFGARIVAYDDPERVLYAGAVEVSEGAYYSFLTDCGNGAKGAGQELYPAPFVHGAGFMIRASMLAQIGLLDERYFLYFEETDFCSRARLHGHRIVVVPSATIRHKVSRSMGGEGSPLQNYFKTRNHLYWARRYMPPPATTSLVRRTVFGVLGPGFDCSLRDTIKDPRRLYWCARGFVRTWNEPTHWARAIGLCDYLRGRNGDCPPIVRRWSAGSPSVSAN